MIHLEINDEELDCLVEAMETPAYYRPSKYQGLLDKLQSLLPEERRPKYLAGLELVRDDNNNNIIDELPAG